MECIRRKLIKGDITLEDYQKEAISFTMHFFKENDYTFNKVLGRGGFGTVVELEHPDYNRVVAKIVLQEHISEGEMDIWPKLDHKNILPVLKVEEVRAAYSSIFYMPVYPDRWDR